MKTSMHVGHKIEILISKGMSGNIAILGKLYKLTHACATQLPFNTP